MAEDMRALVNMEVIDRIGYFFNKVNERSELTYGYRDSYDSGDDEALGETVEYFHPHILYDDRMRYIMENIVLSDIDMDNIICNTIIPHFSRGRGILKLFTQKPLPR